MSDPFLGEIRAFGFNFAPRGWMFCAGQILPIQRYTALFSLLGTNYGGNGTTNFGLPDFSGRTLIGQGAGQGVSPYVVGEIVGAPAITLTTDQLPSHNHSATGQLVAGNASSHHVPVNGDFLTRYATGSGPGSAYNNPPLGNAVLMSPQMVQPAGGNIPHPNEQPYLTLNLCIAFEGIFPSRN